MTNSDKRWLGDCYDTILEMAEGLDEIVSATPDGNEREQLKTACRFLRDAERLLGKLWKEEDQIG